MFPFRVSAVRRTSLACLAACSLGAALLPAQDDLSRGFTQRLPAYASGEERNRQTNLRVMEVQFKPMRMVWVELTNPRTGEKERQAVWYLVYRAVTRPTPARADENDTRPMNHVDPPPKAELFIPEFTLTTYDDPANPVPQSIHLDQVHPEALAAIREIEQRPVAAFQKRAIEHGLSVIQPFPEPVPEDTPPESLDWIYGVATWTGVDPDTDFFQVTMRGFSNAYELQQGPDGALQPWRKVAVQKFIRRGDRFDLNQKEFEFDGGPVWTYQPDETQWSQWTPSAGS